SGRLQIRESSLLLSKLRLSPKLMTWYRVVISWKP
ncbi:hypothetical protein CP082626L3_1102B, partial [Chlamydia psittaci 08-2626_L3]